MLDLYVEISQLLGQAVEVGKMKNENAQSASCVRNFAFSANISHAPKALPILISCSKSCNERLLSYLLHPLFLNIRRPVGSV